MDDEVDCKCMKVIGHLEAVQWSLVPRPYKPSPGVLALGDWTKNPFIWLYYVKSCEGTLEEDDVIMSTDSRYWSIHDVQRYFVGDLHCEKIMFTYQYPNLRMPTPLGSYFWRANTALKLPSSLYLKEFNRSLEMTLKKIENEQAQMDKIIISDQLIKLNKLDYFKRKTFINSLLNILSFQERLQLVSFENMCCDRLEGVRLVQQLACFNSETLKYLFLWRFVETNQNPLLINYSYITGSGQYIPRPTTKHCFLRSLGQLKNLQVLALEYAHIADYTGGAIFSLLPVIKKPHFRLQLICREDQIPCRADAALGVGGYGIPDFVWRRVSDACPNLYLVMSFHRIRDYDNVRRFLTSGVPLREVHLQMGIDLKMAQRQDSDISCFIRHVAFNYSDHLINVSIHQWRFVTFPLRRVFELMPGLVRFSYTGYVEDDVELIRMLNIIACGVCNKLQQVQINIQDQESKREYWTQVIDFLHNQYQEIAQLYNICLCITAYKS